MTDSLAIIEQIYKSFDLKDFNSLAIPAKAEFFCSIDSVSQLQQALVYAKQQNLKITPISGGSNLVLAADVSGLVLHINLKGVSASTVVDNTVDTSVAAGENWHDFVTLCLNNGWHGLENLALIPGNMGAAPIQNIGAYGVEVKDYVEHVEAFDCESMQWVKLYQSDCQFSYRNSIFKTNPSRYVISTIVFNLPHIWQPRITYADLQSYFANRSIDSIKANDIFTAVCTIRSQKLPDPKVIGNVGSFFQNPIVENSMLAELKQRHPAIVAYPEDTNHSKLAAGWLIDQCGFKGMQLGSVGVHDKQALVLTHRGNGDSIELLMLAKTIQETVRERFGVDLVIEPVVYQ